MREGMRERMREGMRERELAYLDLVAHEARQHDKEEEDREGLIDREVERPAHERANDHRVGCFRAERHAKREQKINRERNQREHDGARNEARGARNRRRRGLLGRPEPAVREVDLLLRAREELEPRDFEQPRLLRRRAMVAERLKLLVPRARL